MISEFSYITKTAKARHLFFYQMQNMHMLCLIPMGLCGDLWRLLHYNSQPTIFSSLFSLDQKKKIQFRKKFSISYLVVDLGGIL